MNRIGIYFSGTGNTKLVIEHFMNQIEIDSKIYAIEDSNCIDALNAADEIVIAYPIYYSCMPKIMSDFIDTNATLWNNKRIFIIATMAMFSGDGSGVGARALKKHGAIILGGLHVTMPDCILDVKLGKKSSDKEIQTVYTSLKRLDEVALSFDHERYPQQGLHFPSRVLGLIVQRLWVGHYSKSYKDKPNIDYESCVTCGKCTKVCPMDNLVIQNGRLIQNKKCTLCYRCVHTCPTKSLTIFGKEVTHKPVQLDQFK